MMKKKNCRDQKPETNLSILVVGENDDMVCMTSNLLRFHGYQCRTAGSGTEAIDIIQESEVDVVITDENLSDLNGRQLNNYVKRLCPETEVIIIDQSAKGYNCEQVNAA